MYHPAYVNRGACPPSTYTTHFRRLANLLNRLQRLTETARSGDAQSAWILRPNSSARDCERARYITNERVETAIFLALALEKPLLIEGPAGAGKTEVAKVLAEMLETELVRLQCYEGLDEARALYEWNYQKQLLRLQADEHQGQRWEELSQRSLLARLSARTAVAAGDFARRVRSFC